MQKIKNKDVFDDINLFLNPKYNLNLNIAKAQF